MNSTKKKIKGEIISSFFPVYDVINVSETAFRLHQYYSEAADYNIDSKILNILYTLMFMEMGKEFEMTEEEAMELVDKLDK